MDDGQTDREADSVMDLPSGLVEGLAERVHETWAAKRVEEGWKRGPVRDDAKREHPCLVPYAKLPEAEKDYDRATAMETLRSIIGLGFRIVPPGSRQATVAAAVPGTTDVPSLIRVWNARDRGAAPADDGFHYGFARKMNRLGEYLMADDIAEDGLVHFPGNVRLLQQKALSLLRSGHATSAARLLAPAERDDSPDRAETLGLLGRAYKTLWEEEADPAVKRNLIEASASYYEKAHRASPDDHWAGSNAAVAALIAGDRGNALALAASAKENALRALDAEDYSAWPLSSLGNACLVLGDFEAAASWHEKAAAALGRDWGEISSARGAMRLAVQASSASRELADRFELLYRTPCAVSFSDGAPSDMAFSGPGSEGDFERTIARMASTLAGMDAGFGYASASTAAELCFHEAIIRAGGESHVVLPYEPGEFRSDRILPLGGEPWARRFDEALSRATQVFIVSRQKMERGSASFAYAERVTAGMSLVKARVLRTKAAALDPSSFGMPTTAPRQRYPEERPDRETTMTAVRGTGIRAMLFSDVVKFSTIGESAMPAFVDGFLGAIGRLIASTEHRPLFRNTWGDGLFLVFSSTREAGLFAIEFRDMIDSTDWRARGLPEGMRVRIALHAGPVYACDDPITSLATYFGSHVNHAARIEPVTPPGSIYASEHFAALAAQEGVEELSFEYAGRIPLPKNFGVFPLYALRASAPGRP